jgi:hypothetical protein
MNLMPAHADRKWHAGHLGHVLFLAAFGAYLNVAAYGFQFPAAPDYSLFLPLANWTRDHSLYAHNALRQVFPHMQTFFWPAVGLLARHFDTEHVLFTLFVATKLIFFGAVGLFVCSRVRSRLLCACVVAAMAVSPLLNSQTPIGGTIILDEVSEQAGLGLAIVLLAGVLVADGKWRVAAVVAALSVYVDALHFLHVLPAFAVLAAVDWRQQKREVIAAAALGLVVFTPWYVHFHALYVANYPSDYVTALLVNYPLHITLRWTPVAQIAEGAAILVTTVSACVFARKGELKIERRMEVVATSYFGVMLVGVLAGWFWLTPNVARFMLPRADSLLIPYAVMLIGVYGVSFLETRAERRPATTCFVAALAILFPLCNYVPIILLPTMSLWMNQDARREDRFVAALRGWRKGGRTISLQRIVAGACIVGIAITFVVVIPSTDQLWDFRIPPDDQETACHDAEIWARDNTARDAAFLTPPEACGFRAISERATWGEWSDGNAMYFYPAFAGTFMKRLRAFGTEPVPRGSDIADSYEDAYKKWSWDRAQSVARENGLAYVLQYKDVKYPVAPVYANEGFAIYHVK